MVFKKLDKYSRRERLYLVLRQLVKSSGYTQASIAKRLNTQTSIVGKVLTGERHLEYVEAIDWLDVLGVSSNQFEKLLDEQPIIE